MVYSKYNLPKPIAVLLNSILNPNSTKNVRRYHDLEEDMIHLNTLQRHVKEIDTRCRSLIEEINERVDDLQTLKFELFRGKSAISKVMKNVRKQQENVTNASAVQQVAAVEAMALAHDSQQIRIPLSGIIGPVIVIQATRFQALPSSIEQFLDNPAIGGIVEEAAKKKTREYIRLLQEMDPDRVGSLDGNDGDNRPGETRGINTTHTRPSSNVLVAEDNNEGSSKAMSRPIAIPKRIASHQIHRLAHSSTSQSPLTDSDSSLTKSQSDSSYRPSSVSSSSSSTSSSGAASSPEMTTSERSTDLSSSIGSSFASSSDMSASSSIGVGDHSISSLSATSLSSTSSSPRRLYISGKSQLDLPSCILPESPIMAAKSKTTISTTISSRPISPADLVVSAALNSLGSSSPTSSTTSGPDGHRREIIAAGVAAPDCTISTATNPTLSVSSNLDSPSCTTPMGTPLGPLLSSMLTNSTTKTNPTPTTQSNTLPNPSTSLPVDIYSPDPGNFPDSLNIGMIFGEMLQYKSPSYSSPAGEEMAMIPETSLPASPNRDIKFQPCTKRKLTQNGNANRFVKLTREEDRDKDNEKQVEIIELSD